jgi:hypothetical protein
MRVHVVVARTGIVAALVACALACTAPSIPDEALVTEPDPTLPRRDDAPTESTGPEASTQSAPLPEPPDAGPAPDACAASKSEDDCYACCEANHPKGLQLIVDELRACACKAPGKCAAECASELCAGQPVDDHGDCGECLDDIEGDCRAQVQTACLLDPACTALLVCDSASKCASK